MTAPAPADETKQPSPVRVLFRCDASAEIGGGHVMRCLSLAAALRQRGAECLFATHRRSGRSAPALLESGFELVWIEDDRPEAEWLGALAGRAIDVVVVDKYDVDARAESLYRRVAPRVVVIDDLADRPHDCDLLLDQTYGRDAGDYGGLVPSEAEVLAGSDYALLRPEFLALRHASRERRRQSAAAARILVSLGMTDVGGITARVVEAMLPVIGDRKLDVVVGAQAASLARLETLAAADPRLDLHVSSSQMAELMAAADLAIGAGGTTSWERCCLGLPCVLIVLAPNQQLLAEQLAMAGAAVAVDADRLDRLAAVAADLLNDRDALAEMGTRAAALVDGLGAERVAEAILALAAPPLPGEHALALRRAGLRDRVDVWLWRTSEAARRASGTTGDIPFDGHQRWWQSKLSDPQCLLLIATVGAQSAGQVRFDWATEDEPDGAIVSIALAPHFMGKGLAASILRQALQSCYDDLQFRGPFIASIRDENLASRRLFERCGFLPSGERDGMLRYRLEALPHPSEDRTT